LNFTGKFAKISGFCSCIFYQLLSRIPSSLNNDLIVFKESTLDNETLGDLISHYSLQRSTLNASNLFKHFKYFLLTFSEEYTIAKIDKKLSGCQRVLAPKLRPKRRFWRCSSDQAERINSLFWWNWCRNLTRTTRPVACGQFVPGCRLGIYKYAIIFCENCLRKNVLFMSQFCWKNQKYLLTILISTVTIDYHLHICPRFHLFNMLLLI